MSVLSAHGHLMWRAVISIFNTIPKCSLVSFFLVNAQACAKYLYAEKYYFHLLDQISESKKKAVAVSLSYSGQSRNANAKLTEYSFSE